MAAESLLDCPESVQSRAWHGMACPAEYGYLVKVPVHPVLGVPPSKMYSVNTVRRNVIGHMAKARSPGKVISAGPNDGLPLAGIIFPIRSWTVLR